MFQVYNANIGDSEVIEYRMMKSAETAVFGEALKLTADGLTKCGAAEKPEYICRGEVQPDGTIPVGVVMATTNYIVPYTAKPAVAAKVQLHTDGLQVTATTGGAFLVISVDEGSKTAVGRVVDTTA